MSPHHAIDRCSLFSIRNTRIYLDIICICLALELQTPVRCGSTLHAVSVRQCAHCLVNPVLAIRCGMSSHNIGAIMRLLPSCRQPTLITLRNHVEAAKAVLFPEFHCRTRAHASSSRRSMS